MYQDRSTGRQVLWLILIVFAALVVAWVTLMVRAHAQETDVWLFYGAGPHGLSSGMDRVARLARPLAGVSHVSVYDYRDTQRAYDEITATPSSHQIIVGGYSCGGNAALVVARALTRPVALLGIQPSVWCGRHETTSNIVYAQDTYSPCWMTVGLGCMQWKGGARHTVLIERPQRHLEGDNDVMAQRDMLFAIAAIAKPTRRHWLTNHLARTTHFIRASGSTIRVGEGR